MRAAALSAAGAARLPSTRTSQPSHSRCRRLLAASSSAEGAGGGQQQSGYGRGFQPRPDRGGQAEAPLHERPLMLEKVNNRTRNGLTPLHLAAQSGMADTVSLLLSFGASVDAVGDNRTTPLMLAVRPDEWELLVERLVFHGSWAEPGEQPNQRHVLLQLAQAGANLDARNSDGRTVADLVARSKNKALMNSVQALRAVTPVRRRAPQPPPARRINVQAVIHSRRQAASAQLQRAGATAPAAHTTAPRAVDAAVAQCVVCMDAPRALACIPCGHMTYCVECVRTLDERNRRKCCICRAQASSIVRIYHN